MLMQASKGRLSLLRLLIKGKANLKARDSTGSTALHRQPAEEPPLSSQTHPWYCIDALLIPHNHGNVVQAGLEIFPCRACSAGKLDAVHLLVEEAGVPLESKDRSGATPVSVAAAAGEKNIALFLISKGADVEVSMSDRALPLTLIATMPGLLHCMTFSPVAGVGIQFQLLIYALSKCYCHRQGLCHPARIIKETTSSNQRRNCII